MVCVKLLTLGLAVLGSIHMIDSLPNIPPLGMCPTVPTDIVISVPAGDRRYTPSFETELQNLVNYFDINNGTVRVGLQLHGLFTFTVLNLFDGNNLKRVNTGISFLSRRQFFHPAVFNSGQNYLFALRRLAQQFRWSRPYARKIAIMFSEGEISENEIQANKVLGEALGLKSSGVLIYNLGSSVIQTIPDEFELTGTDRCRLFSLGQNWFGLRSAVAALANGICGELDDTVDVVVGGNCFPRSYAPSQQAGFICTSTGDYADPHNCVYYYRCVEGHQPFHTTCADGTFFNTSFVQNEYNYYCAHWYEDPCSYNILP